MIQDYVSLKKSGANYKGLCPFHAEKTPSFTVNRDKGFFHCHGCKVGGDVIKFLELHEKLGFHDAVKQLAQRFGLSLPEMEANDEQRASAAERETLLKIHEAAAAWFRAQLLAPGGVRVRKQIADRGLSEATSEAQGLGFAPPSRDALTQAMLGQGFSRASLLKAGLLVQRDDGQVVDRFRNRLMIPIARDTGSIIAFGGRALEADQQPEVPELTGNADLFEESNALRTAPVQGGHSPARFRRPGRGLLRFWPGPSGRLPGCRLVRHGAHTAAGPAAQALRRQGGAQLRSRCRRPGRHGSVE